MPTEKKFKQKIRARQAATGESYTTARRSLDTRPDGSEAVGASAATAAIQAWRRERLPAIVQGRGTPWWMRHPESRQGAHIGEMVSSSIAYARALVVHVVPFRFPHQTNELWPPTKGLPAVDVEDVVARAKDGDRDPQLRALEERRAAVRAGLLSRAREPRATRAWLAHDLYELDAVLAREGMSDRDNIRPHVYATLRRDGRLESAFDLRPRGNEIDMGVFTGLPDHLAIQLQTLDGLRAEPPIAIAISIVGARGLAVCGPPADDVGRYRSGAFDEDVVTAPVIELGSFDADLMTALQRPYDALWKRCGLERCHLLELRTT